MPWTVRILRARPAESRPLAPTPCASARRPGGAVVAPHVSAPSSTRADTTPEVQAGRGTGPTSSTAGIRADVRLTRRLGADVRAKPVIRFTDTVTGEECCRKPRFPFRRSRAPVVPGGGLGVVPARGPFARLRRRAPGWALAEPAARTGGPQAASPQRWRKQKHSPCGRALRDLPRAATGFLWNNPAVGRCDLPPATSPAGGPKATPGTRLLWICAGDGPQAIHAPLP